MKSKHWDVLIIGGGISGWLSAKALSKQGYSVALVEATPLQGGLTRSHNSPVGTLDQNLGIIPATDDARAALALVESLTGLDIAGAALEAPPVTFEKGSLSPFVGFGETPPPEVDEILWYARTNRIELKRTAGEWIESLQQDTPVDVFSKSQVTRFEVENGIVKSVQINGDRFLSAEKFVFAGHPQDLPQLFADGILAPKFIQKISRARLWTSVSLQVVHETDVTAETGLHVLMGGGENARACIGRFQGRLSQWLTFLPTDESDEDTAATALREMKRQIKRVYPQALDNVAWERISISPRSHGQIPTKEEKDGTVPGLENLWLASPLLDQERGLVGAIERVRYVLDQIGIVSPSVSTETATELAL